MPATTTLRDDLAAALTTTGLDADSTTTVVRLLPPAGRHSLLTVLHDRPDTALTELTGMFLGDLAALLRTTWSDAASIRTHFAAVTR